MACRNTDSDGPLYIEVLSGDGTGKAIPSLRGRNDVRHIVKIENLSTFPAAKIECIGQNSKVPRSIEFSSGSAGGTPETWRGSCAVLGSGGTLVFDHALLRAVSSSGTDPIDAEVTAEWVKLGQKPVCNAQIDVSV